MTDDTIIEAFEYWYERTFHMSPGRYGEDYWMSNGYSDNFVNGAWNTWVRMKYPAHAQKLFSYGSGT